MSDTHNHDVERKDQAHSHDDGHDHAHDDLFTRLLGGRAEIIFAALCGLCLIAGWLGPKLNLIPDQIGFGLLLGGFWALAQGFEPRFNAAFVGGEDMNIGALQHCAINVCAVAITFTQSRERGIFIAKAFQKLIREFCAVKHLYDQIRYSLFNFNSVHNALFNRKQQIE